MKRIVILLALAILVYTLTIVYSAPSITFDNTNYPTLIFRYYASNNSYSSNLATSSSFQLFSNNAKVGDMIYFGYAQSYGSTSTTPWHDLYFSIDVPLQGTGIQLVWEYYNNTAGTWMSIPNLVDGTNKFTKSGWVTFPIPPYWFYGTTFDGLKINNYGSLWVRVRLANGTVTNGGHVNQRVQIHDYTLTIQNYPSINFTYIYKIVKQNGWNIMVNPDNNTYIIFCNVKFVNSTLYSSKEIIQIGTQERPMTIQADYYSKLYFGKLASNGVGIDGSEIYLYTKMMTPYLPIGHFYFYGSRFVRYGGQFASPMFSYNVSIIDSQLVSDTQFYFPSGSNGTLIRVLYSVPAYIYIYSSSISINQLILPSNAQGVLVGAGSPAVVSNVVFSSGQYLNRYYDAWVDLIDCVISPSQILNTLPQNRDVWVRKRYSFNLKLIDKNGNPVSGATVKLYDTYGNLVFSLTTNSTGQIPTQYVLTYITWWNKSENWNTRHEKYYTPFTLVISHPSYPPIQMKWDIQQPVNLLLPIDPLDPAQLYVNTTRSLYLPKDVVIINAYVLYQNVKQTGLKINATVFKPDGTKSSLIQLRDDGQFPDTVANDGLYAGLFTDTSKTGTYLVNASTIFQSGTLKANWTFIVDNTGDLIQSVNNTLYNKIQSVNSTLYTKLSQISSQLSGVNSSLYTQIKGVNTTLYNKILGVNSSIYNKIVSVNNTLYQKINTVSTNLLSINGTIIAKLNGVNTTLYGKIVSINNSLYLKINTVNSNLLLMNGTLVSKLNNVNATLYGKIVAINNSLYLKINTVNTNLLSINGTLNSKLNSMNSTLYGKIVTVNSTLYLKINDVSLKLTSINGTLYNTIVNANNTLYTKLIAVNSSLYAKIVAVNNSLYLKISSISFNTTPLENKIASVNNTLYTKLNSVNVTLYGKIVQVNNTLYLKVNDVLLRVTSINGSLYNAISSSNSTIMSKLAQEDTAHNDILNKLGNINLTLYGKLEDINNTLVLRIQNASLQIQSVNSTVTSTANTITGKLTDITSMLSKINVDFSPVLTKIDQATNMILDALSKISSQLNNNGSQSVEVSIPSWVIWLLVTQVLLLFFIYLAIKRQSGMFTAPQLQPTSGSRVAKVVFAVIILAVVYLLLVRLSAYIPIPVPIVMGVIVLLVVSALMLGVKKTLVIALALGIIGYLAGTRLHVSIPSTNVPIPVITLTIVFILFTIIYIALSRRKKQQVMVW